MENYNTENFEEVTFAPDDFTLTQADVKIHDTKFQTKTIPFFTKFLKDHIHFPLKLFSI